MVNVKLTWEDNSTGALEETGQELDIWTDSPSFVPNVPINYMEARHPWMRLPPIAAGVETLDLPLKTPVTFVKFRVRQYNANGSGPWSLARVVTIAQAVGVLVPQAPINLGGVVSGGTVTPPPPPPIDPPPPPPPIGGGGTSSNYSYVNQFSGVQGQNQWSYKDASGANMTYSVADNLWNGSQLYQGIWNGGMHPGPTVGAMLRWTAPSNGTALVSGTFNLVTSAGSSGVVVTIKHNATTIHGPQTLVTADVQTINETVVVVAGDTIDFIVAPNSGNTYASTAMAPVISLTTDGSTPANPTVSSVLPAAATIAFGGSQSLTVTLSSAPSVFASVVMSSSDITKVVAPSTLIIPAGQSSALVTVTGVAFGASTITATYNSSSKSAVVTVGSPVSISWPNAPLGGTVILDHNFNTVAPLIMGFNNTQIVSDATAPFSPSSVARHRIEAFNGSGGDETYYRTGSFRELYVGFYWRMNPQFQGRIVPNKLWFIRSEGFTNTFFGVYGGPNTGQSNFYLAAGPNTGTINNAHLFNGDPIGNCYPNTGASANVVPGVWYKVESSILSSSTPTSRDGRLRIWLNEVLVVDYPNFNMCGPQGQPMNQIVWNETWDNTQDMGVSNTVPWEHYMDHWYIVGKN